jgi:hypothetical protein
MYNTTLLDIETKFDKKFYQDNLERMKKEREELSEEEKEYYIRDANREIKRIELILEIKQQNQTIKEIKKQIKTIDYKEGETKELSDEELRNILYQLSKNKYIYLTELIKLLLENQIETNQLENLINETNISEKILEQKRNLDRKYKNYDFAEIDKSLNIEKSISLTINNTKEKKELLSKLKIEEKEYEMYASGSNKLETFHINRQDGMLNCAALSDIGENVMWTISDKPSINTMLIIKSKIDKKPVFSSYVKLLKNNEEKETELLIDNIEGNKEYKNIGIKGYRTFIKEIIKSQLSLYQKGKKLLVDKITISDEYSKIQSTEINSDAKILNEYQEIQKNEYSDAISSRIELFNIKELFNKYPKITKEEIDKIEIKGAKISQMSDMEYIKRKIKKIIKKDILDKKSNQKEKEVKIK